MPGSRVVINLDSDDRARRRRAHDGYAPPIRSAYRRDPDHVPERWVSPLGEALTWVAGFLLAALFVGIVARLMFTHFQP